ncbi:MAG: hypothetical protein LQ346_001573 [Caloplaca aetnensis]|nr:MAG: hypothetical protein LQ346_001573 [Caloplaca aetnensis]
MGFITRLKAKAIDSTSPFIPDRLSPHSPQPQSPDPKYFSFSSKEQDRLRHKYTRGRRPSVYANTYNFPPASSPSSSSSSSPHFSYTSSSSSHESISTAKSTTKKKDPWYRRLWKKASFASRRASASGSEASVLFVSEVVELRPRREERWPLE